ncbi:MAG: MBL fold metallo-hydrolase [Pseudomonadales bacterium]|nr:MBL fold metallo-hydrolase [Pseudomonadales bacterium]
MLFASLTCNVVNRSLLISLLLLASSVVSAAEPAALTDEQLAKLSLRAVAGKTDLYVIPGFGGAVSGGNIAVLVTQDGVVVVDNKFDYSHDDIVSQIRSITDQPITTVLNTHHHFDHAGSNPHFLAYAQVIGHDNARANMLANRRASADPTGAPPITYSDTTTLHLGDHKIELHHFGRGHTNGDTVVYFADLKTVHTGDLFIWGERLDGSKLAPFIDYDNGGSARDWAGTLDKILALDFDTVIPGHGAVLTRSEIETFRHRFEVLVGRVAQAIAAGISREGVAEAVEVEDLDWPLTADRIELIYDELSP